MGTIKESLPWVLVGVKEVVYAISCESVLSLNQIGKVTPLPKVPEEVRGVIDFRNHQIQLIDTRKLLNLNSTADEIDDFFAMMDLRKSEHENWLKTLEEAVLEDKEFTLTTDPHQCAFGKWYDKYDPKNTNIMFLATFAKFDKPHKAIHEIGITAEKLIKAGKKEEAVALIEKTRNREMRQMIGLFNDLKEAYAESRREIVVALGNDLRGMGLAVDEIVAIEHLSEIDANLIKDTMTQTEYIMGVGKRKDDSVVFLLNDSYILDKYSKKYSMND